MKRVQQDPSSDSDDEPDAAKRPRLDQHTAAALEAALQRLSCQERPPTATAAAGATAQNAGASSSNTYSSAAAQQPAQDSMSIPQLLHCLGKGGKAAEAAALHLGNLTAQDDSSGITALLRHDDALEILVSCLASSSLLITEQAVRGLSNIASVEEAHTVMALAGAATALLRQCRITTSASILQHAVRGVANLCSSDEGATAIAAADGTMDGLLACLSFGSCDIVGQEAARAVCSLAKRALGAVLQHPSSISTLFTCLSHSNQDQVAYVAECLEVLTRSEAGTEAVLHYGRGVQTLVDSLGHTSNTVVCHAYGSLTCMGLSAEHRTEAVTALVAADAAAAAVSFLQHSGTAAVVCAALGLLSAMARTVPGAHSILQQPNIMALLLAYFANIIPAVEHEAAVNVAAGRVLLQLAHSNEGRAAIIHNPSAMAVLVSALRSAPALVAQRAAGALANLAGNLAGATAVLVQPGAVAGLVAAVGCATDGAASGAARALGQLAANNPAGSNAVAAAGAIPALVKCLRISAAATQVACKALQQITAGSPANFMELINIISKMSAEHHEMGSIAAVVERLQASERNLQEAIVRTAWHVPGTSGR